jgi:hypothetical protein
MSGYCSPDPDRILEGEWETSTTASKRVQTYDNGKTVYVKIHEHSSGYPVKVGDQCYESSLSLMRTLTIDEINQLEHGTPSRRSLAGLPKSSTSARAKGQFGPGTSRLSCSPKDKTKSPSLGQD